jgi:hypothetical protein
MSNFRSSMLFIAMLVVLVLATSAYAFGSSSTVPTTRAGEGRGTIPGYTVSNIVYAFDNANPSNLTTVAFDLNNPAATVKVSATTAGTLQNCTSAAPFTHWTCTLTGVTVTSTSSLRVVATR